MQRPDYDEYFMEMAFLVSRRSTFLLRQVDLLETRNAISMKYSS